MFRRRKQRQPPVQAPLAVQSRPLVHGRWPSPEARLIVEGVIGLWSFVGAEDYGQEYCLVQLVRHGSDPEHAPRSLAKLSRVREVI